MKKIVSMLFVVAFVLTTFSCAEPEEIVPEYPSLSNDLDFGGMKFKYVTEQPGTFLRIIPDTLLYDCVMERIDEIEKNFNCELNVEYPLSTGSQYDYCRTQISSGLCPADIVDLYTDNRASHLAYAGYLYPLTDVKDIIDYEDSFKYGSAAVLECAMYEGVPYAVQPVSWPGFPDSHCFFLGFNKDKVAAEGLTNLHEYYENNIWTWETFESVLWDYTSTDPSDPYKAIAATIKAVSDAALFSNGVRLVDYIDGEFKTALYEPKVLTSIEWVQSLYSDYRDCILPVDYLSLSEFINNQALISFVSSLQAYSSDLQYDCDFTFGLMPLPCGPDAVYGQWANWREGIYGVCMPVTVPEPRATAHIISALLEPFEEFGTTIDDLKKYYADNVFASELDAEIYFEIGKHGCYIYWPFGGHNLTVGIAEDYASKSAQQIVETYVPTMDEVIEKYIVANFENYMYEHLK